MNCRKFSALLFAHQDGSLAGSERAEFELHARSCQACARRLEEAERLGRALRGAVPPVPAPDWDESWRVISASLPPRPDRRRRSAFSPRWALVAGGFLLFFILGAAAARLFLSPPRAAAPVADEAPFLYSAKDYFAALHPLMAAYANAGSAGDEAPADRARVRRLLGDLYLLKGRAARARDASLLHLLADIELVLLEIAHLDRSDPENVRMVGALIQEKGIPLKLRVYKFDERKSARI